MAYMGRGGFSSIGGGDSEDSEQNINTRRELLRGSWIYRRFCYYIPLDNTYVIMQMIATFIILIVGAITFIFTYKSEVVDPIVNIKNTFINIHLAIMGIFVILTFIIHYLSKNESILYERLILFLIISIMVMLIFLGYRLNMDTIYTKEWFENNYTEEHQIQDKNEKRRISISLSETGFKNEKEFYVDENVKLYNIFKIKSIGIFALNLLLELLLIYQISRIAKIKEKKQKINKDDIVLFDEEQNVKY